MKNKIIALLLLGVVTLMVTSHPVYAHEFSGNEESAWLAKVQNLKAEMAALKMDVGDSDATDWHVDKVGEYWTDSDAKELDERNKLLAKEIPDTINAIIKAAQSSNPDSSDIAQKITTLNGYLDESVSARLNKADLKNGTIQAFAVTGIITETLEDYAEAIGTDVDLNDMESMSSTDHTHDGSDNMGGMDHGGEMKTESTTLTIVEGSSTNDAKCVSDNSCFGKATLTVAPGTKVTWVNGDTAAHTITSGTPTDGPDGTFDSSLLPASKSYSFTFDDEGTYDYFCQVHPWMTGEIKVSATKGMSYDESDNASIHYVADNMDSMGSGETAVPIANTAAYHSAQMLSSAAKNYYHSTVLPLASGSDVKSAQAADDGLGQLVDAINKKSDADTIMQIVHVNTHPNLITAYKLPEFPLPVMLVILAMVGVIAAARFGPKLRYS